MMNQISLKNVHIDEEPVQCEVINDYNTTVRVIPTTYQTTNEITIDETIVPENEQPIEHSIPLVLVNMQLITNQREKRNKTRPRNL